jgi:cell wall-associated NlpC family hydrolase
MRPHIIAIARSWLGTPYHHQASVKGVGTDCIGLVRGIWRELYGREAQALPAYTRDWAEAHARETLLDAARRHLIEVPAADPIVCGTMIHALEGAPVSEVSFSPWWRRHLAGAFMFPSISEWRKMKSEQGSQ